MGARNHFQQSAVSVTGAWIRVVKGQSQIMLEIDGQWHEILPQTNVGDADISIEIPASEIAKSQPLGWLYKNGN